MLGCFYDQLISIDKDSTYILLRITILCVCEGLMPLMPQITSASTAQNCCSNTPAWAVTELLSKSHLLSWHYLRALPRAGKTSGDPEPYCWATPREGSTEKWGGGWFTWKESNPHLQGKEKEGRQGMLLFLFFIPFKAEKWLWDKPRLHVRHKGSKSAEQNWVERITYLLLGSLGLLSSFLLLPLL